MTPVIANGSTLHISTGSASTAEGYETLSWVQVRGVRSVPEITDSWQTAERFVVGDTRPVQVRTARAALQLQLELARCDDAGQQMLRAALDDVTARSFCVRLPDGVRYYFSAQVNSVSHSGLSPGSLAELRVALAIQGDIISL